MQKEKIKITDNMTNSEGFSEAIFWKTGRIPRKNGAAQWEKTRCAGMLTVFR